MKRKGFVAVVSVIAAATFVFSLYMIVTTLITRAQEQSAFDELAAAVEQQREQAEDPDGKPEQITSPVVAEPTAEADTEPVILPEYAAHDGVFTSEYGTMTFNGDGESITFDFMPELQEATGLPGSEQSGSYVFLFQHGQWRYDKAERLRITASDASYDFINDSSMTDENTIALQSPLNGKETILFIKGEK